jgi:hypothetical protein
MARIQRMVGVMMSDKFTKGPWEVEHDWRGNIHIAAGRDTIARLEKHYHSPRGGPDSVVGATANAASMTSFANSSASKSASRDRRTRKGKRREHRNAAPPDGR